jgi:CHAT domain-containing protein
MTAAKPKFAPEAQATAMSGQGVAAPLGIVLLIVLVSGLGIWRLFFYRSTIDKGLQVLHAAYREQRPTEARLTGFDYAPPPPSVRGSEPERVDYVARDHAERVLLDAYDGHPEAQSHHALGRLYLAEHKLVEAGDQLEKALRLDEKNAQIESDYGLTLMEMGKAERLKGESGKGLEILARSLDHLNQALNLDSSQLEALFNRALWQEYMLLYRGAEKDWQGYIQKDPDSQWAAEAKQKLAELKERLPRSVQPGEQLLQAFLDAYKARDDTQAWKAICQSRDSTAGFIENRLADAYLDLAAKGCRHEATERLKALSYAGELAYQQAQDQFIPDLIRFYKSATSAQRDRVAQARGLMQSGHENYLNNNPITAQEFYRRAKEIFARAEDTCEALHATYLIGNCDVQQSKAASGLALLQPLARTCEENSYRLLLARTLYAICNANQYLRDFSMAISSASRSLALSEEIGDVTGAIKTRHYLGDIYRFVNQSQKALALHIEDLSLAQTYLPQPALLWRHYASISLTFDQLDQPAAAIGFQKEALQLALEAEAPRLIGLSYNFLGFLLAEHGQFAEAADHIKRAIEIEAVLPERRIRIGSLAYSFLQLGYVYRKMGHFADALENYDQAIQSYDELDSVFFNYLARKDRLLCCIEQGECPSVEAEMEAVLKLFEQHQAKILEESLRNTFFDGEQTIYDVAMGFAYVQKQDPKKAFEYSERNRARWLHDSTDASPQIVDNPNNPDVRYRSVTSPLGLEEIQARLPEQVAILQYAVLKNDLLIWVVSRDGFATASQRLPIEELNRRVNHFLRLVQGGSENDREALSQEAAHLYDFLIRPVEPWLGNHELLCIVPDKALNYLPFGALISGSGKYFVQEHGFVLSPSSNSFILCSQVAREKESAENERLLSVGNPLFDSQTAPDLESLPSAAQEATAITEYYQSSGLVLGPAATKRRVMSEMEKSDVIHLATHAVADEWYPLRSKLLLAKDAAAGKDSNGVLQAYEIYRLNLRRAKLVVLSACGTAVQKYYGGEGMVGLSRPFIAKQIPLVVASLWPVNTVPTAKLMISFHRHRKRDGMSTAEALRQAQLDLISADGSDSLPYNWAMFVVIGGYARY